MSYCVRLYHVRARVFAFLKTLRPILAILLLPTLALSEDQAVAGPDATGGIKLKWTAPGDDGYVGKATGYDIRFQPLSLGPLNTEAEWQAATMIAAVPIPSPAGQKDSVLVLGLTPGLGYYFALRTCDEVGNKSQLSNSPLIVATSVVCCTGRVGDVNGLDGDEPTIGDATTLIDHLFVSRRALWCPGEADMNLSGGSNPQQGADSDISIGDITILIDYLFLTGRPLPYCM
ncbi:MAG: hypothetical protein AB1772_01180 [Candidatus Zixiibacteriota bacterium]